MSQFDDFDHYDDEDEEEYLDFTGTLKYESEKAYLIDIDGDEIWVPKSQIEFENNPRLNKSFDFEIPRWIAEDKGIA